MLTLDILANSSRLRHWNAVEKVLPAVALLLIVLIRPVLPVAPLVLATTTLAAVGLGQISLVRWVRALLLPASFIVAGAIGIVLVSGDGPGPIPLTVTSGSLIAGAEVVMRSLAGTSAVVLIGVTTPMVDLIALLRAMRVPSAVTDLMAAMYRLMFDLIETGRQIRVSQTARLGHDGFVRSLRSSAASASAVFIRSVHRARRMQIGLDARAYNGELRVLSPVRPIDGRRLLAGVAVAGTILAGSFVTPA